MRGVLGGLDERGSPKKMEECGRGKLRVIGWSHFFKIRYHFSHHENVS